MKKTIGVMLILVSILTLGMSAVFIDKSTKKPEKESYAQFLHDAGFTNVSSISKMIANEERSEWEAKGFRYVSYGEMDKLLADNGFIVATADRYVDVIPDDKMVEIKKNYEALEDDMLSYVACDRRDVTSPELLLSYNEISRCWSTCNKSSYHVIDENILKVAGLPTDCDHIKIVETKQKSPIYVVAHASKFLPETTNDPGKIEAKINPDPIAVIKHRNGYLVLASW